MKKKNPIKTQYLSRPDAKVAEISYRIKKFNDKEALGHEETQHANIGYLCALRNYKIINDAQLKILRTCFIYHDINWLPNTYFYINSEGILVMETY